MGYAINYPLVWDDTETKYLPTPFNTKDAEVYGINKDGIMVGYAYSNAGDYSAMLWQNGQYYNMNTQLDPDAVAAGWTVSTLWDINDNGTIVASGIRAGGGSLVLLVPNPAVQLITPSGDSINAPVDTAVDGQNEFTSSSANPGVLAVHLKAKVLAVGTAGSLASRCRFTIDPIPGSTMAWGTNNPNGQPTTTSGDFLEADVTFTGLPISNSSFGRKNVMITVDGVVRDQKAMEVFFPRDAANHPGGTSTDPNWFYYWKDGNVCGIGADCVWDPTHPTWWGYTLPGSDTLVRLCSQAPIANSGPETYTSATYGTYVVTGQGKGIQCVAETIQHERHHLTIYQTFGLLVQQVPPAPNDPDGDALPSPDESGFDGMTSDPNDPNTFAVPGYADLGDNEIRCRNIELTLTIPIFPERDWANPGCHSKNQNGPTP